MNSALVIEGFVVLFHIFKHKTEKNHDYICMLNRKYEKVPQSPP